MIATNFYKREGIAYTISSRFLLEHKKVENIQKNRKGVVSLCIKVLEHQLELESEIL